MLKKKRKKFFVLFLVLSLLTGNLQAVFALEHTVTPAKAEPMTEQEGIETVLYADGMLIINEMPAEREVNFSLHGERIKTYPAWDNAYPYTFSKPEEQLWFNEKDKITAVEFGMEISPKSTAYWFSGLKNLERMNLDRFSFSNIEDMTSMFEGTGSEKSCIIKGNVVLSRNVKAGYLFKHSRITCTVEVEGVPLEDTEIFLDSAYEVTIVAKDDEGTKWAERMKKDYAGSPITVIPYRASAENEPAGESGPSASMAPGVKAGTHLEKQKDTAPAHLVHGSLLYTDDRTGTPKFSVEDPTIAAVWLYNPDDSRGIQFQYAGLKEGTTNIIVEYQGLTMKMPFTVTKETTPAFNLSGGGQCFNLTGNPYQILNTVPVGKENGYLIKASDQVKGTTPVIRQFGSPAGDIIAPKLDGNTSENYRFGIAWKSYGKSLMTVTYKGETRLYQLECTEDIRMRFEKGPAITQKTGQLNLMLLYSNLPAGEIPEIYAEDPNISMVQMYNAKDARGFQFAYVSFKPGVTKIIAEYKGVRKEIKLTASGETFGNGQAFKITGQAVASEHFLHQTVSTGKENGFLIEATDGIRGNKPVMTMSNPNLGTLSEPTIHSSGHYRFGIKWQQSGISLLTVEYKREKNLYLVASSNVQNGTWVNTPAGWKYRLPDGTLVKDQMIKVKSSSGSGPFNFYFNQEGIMQTGYHKVNGKPYFFAENGAGANKGWVSYGNNVRMYSKGDGELVTGWMELGDYKYKFNENGFLLPENTQLRKKGVNPPAIASGTIATQGIAICQGGTQFDGGTYVCTIKGSDGLSLNGCCLNPKNDYLAPTGRGVKLSKYANSSLMAKIAYLGSLQYGTDDQKYIVSRCAARGAGNVAYNNYHRQAQVNALYDRAVAAGPAPDNFEAYYGTPVNGEQQLLAWRYTNRTPDTWIPYKEKGNLNLKKSSTDPSFTASLAGAKYGVYKWSDEATQGINEVGTLITDENGNSNTLSLEPHLYYVKEIEAPKGYMLDETIYMISVNQKETLTVSVKDEPDQGKLKLKKTVAQDEHLTSLCSEQYTLADAEYTVYKERTCKTEVGKLITTEQKKGADGKLYAESNELNLAEGIYYVQETKAPKGYKIDNKVYPATLKNGQTTVLPVKDVPMFDPLTLTLQKHIPEGKPWTKQYLKDAEYTVRYYSKYLNTPEEVAKETPLRTWVFRTDEDGTFQIDDNPKMNWYVGGDKLFKQEDGTVIGLYGTYTFEETKAPPGFIKNEGITIRQIHQGIEPDNIDDTNHGDAENVAAEEVNTSVHRQIVATKKISEENVYAPYGIPTAIFELVGTDVYGNVCTYRKSITLDSSTLKNGYYTGTVVFDDLPAGLYDLSEVKTSRYTLKGITEVSANGTVEGEVVHFELMNTAEGKATYENEISRWNDLSDTDCVVNKF